MKLPRAIAASLARLGALALLSVLGCSALVQPRDPEPRCELNDLGVQVCPAGLQCIDGRCKHSCSGVQEVCRDNLDNDCDGQIDEADALGRDTCGDGVDNDCDGTTDEGSDGDSDGFSWCGDTSNPGSGLRAVDCDDFDALANPEQVEICDGRDNDCDGTIDDEENGALCPPGSVCSNQRCVFTNCASEGPRVSCGQDERCDAVSGMCVPRSCDCQPDESCDTASNTCKPRARMPNGATCATASDCLSNSCIDAAALRFAAPGRVCGQACCDDAQCGPDERCFASGTGARSCLPTSLLPSAGPVDCVTDEICADNQLCGLTRDQSIAAPQFKAHQNIATGTCVATAPVYGVGQRCTLYPECQTRICMPGPLFGNLCSNTCGSSNDCLEFDEAVKLNGGLGGYCRFVDLTIDVSSPNYAAICVVRRIGETGSGVYGQECASGRDCREGGCVEATSTTKGRCTSTCCNDSQCGPREDGKPIVCRPFAFGERYEMRCDI